MGWTKKKVTDPRIHASDVDVGISPAMLLYFDSRNLSEYTDQCHWLQQLIKCCFSCRSIQQKPVQWQSSIKQTGMHIYQNLSGPAEFWYVDTQPKTWRLLWLLSLLFLFLPILLCKVGLILKFWIHLDVQSQIKMSVLFLSVWIPKLLQERLD